MSGRRIWLIVVDSLDELARLSRIAASGAEEVAILLRVNPDYVPEGMNQGGAGASRRGSAFGLDLHGGEVQAALGQLRGGAAARTTATRWRATARASGRMIRST